MIRNLTKQIMLLDRELKYKFKCDSVEGCFNSSYDLALTLYSLHFYN